jgi:arylsulfatase/uncharacterized sulfatase
MNKAALLLLLAACCSAVTAAPQKPRPNIVVLLADDWGFSDVGAFGGEIATPHLDSLARQGMKFSNFHVSASCSPTRSMLLTGVDNHRNGVGNMRETIPLAHMGKPGYLTVLNKNVVTVASLLQDGGYRTYVAGKWHVGKEAHNLPNQRGFDRSLVQGDSGSDNWQTAKRYLDLTDKVDWFDNGRPAVMPADYYSSEFFVSKMIEYIGAGEQAGQPFFAYVPFQANHIPLQAPRDLINKYRGLYKDGWTVLRQKRRDKAVELGLIPPDAPLGRATSADNWDALSETDKLYQARRMEVYAAMAEAMDQQIGRLIAHIKQIGAYENTVFIFLSDNGAEASDPYAVLTGRLWLDWQYNRDLDRLGSRGAYTVIGPNWAGAAVSPLRTYKFYSGEGGIRVPLIVAGAPGMLGNSIQRHFTHVNDIAPTLLDLAQIKPNQGLYRGQPVETMTGRSLLPALQGQAERVHPADVPVGYELSGNQALFKGDLKLIKNIPPVGDGLWHLYDIVKDPGETRDLQLELPEQFRTMQADYAAYAKANGVLDMPGDYEPVQQVIINAAVNVYWPRYKAALLLLLTLLLAVPAAMLYRRRQRQRT